MAILRRYGLFVLIWGAFFSLAFWAAPNRAEEDLLMLQKVLRQIEEWDSYTVSQTMTVGGRKESEVRVISHQNPYLAHVESKVRLTDDEDFTFEAYFQPEAIYVYTPSNKAWTKTDYTHPAAGELEGVKHPGDLWLRLLAHTAHITRTETKEGRIVFSLQLRPFREEINGFSISDVQTAKLEAWLTPNPPRVEKVKLTTFFKPNILRGYNEMIYENHFSAINQAPDIYLPMEAYTFRKINK